MLQAPLLTRRGSSGKRRNSGGDKSTQPRMSITEASTIPATLGVVTVTASSK
jgi:hypothetical protein